MPIFNNPAVLSYMNQQGVNAPSLRSLGMAAPFPSPPDVVRIPGTQEASPMFRLGDAAAGMVEDRQLMQPLGKYVQALSSGRGPGQAALLTAVLGGLGGAGFGLTTRRDPLLWGLVGAGVGGLGGLGLNSLLRSRQARRDARQRYLLDELRKSSFYVSNEQDPMTFIQQKLFEDSTMGSNAKGQMVAQLRSLPRQDLITLADMLRTATGAAVGYIIGRFLLRFGGIGTAVLTGIGGLIGAQSGRPKVPKNMSGLEVDPTRDFFGRPRLVY